MARFCKISSLLEIRILKSSWIGGSAFAITSRSYYCKLSPRPARESVSESETMQRANANKVQKVMMSTSKLPGFMSWFSLPFRLEHRRVQPFSFRLALQRELTNFGSRHPRKQFRSVAKGLRNCKGSLNRSTGDGLA